MRVPETTVREIGAFLRASASFLAAPAPPPPVTIRDPDDAVILSEALALRADVLVTGDKDLLEVSREPRAHNPGGHRHQANGSPLSPSPPTAVTRLGHD